MPGTIRIEVVTSFDRLEALRAPWAALWLRAPAATPFSTPAWLLAWCRHLADGPPVALAAWRGPELAGLAPTFTYDERGERVLGLLGGGVSDYQEVLAEDAGVAAALLEALGAPGAHDRCDLQALPAGSPFLAAARAAGAGVAPQEVCPFLALPPEPDAVLDRAAPGLRADVRRQRRRLARAGRAEVLHEAGPGWPAALDDLFQLHALRWRSRGEAGVLAEPRLRAFHEAAAGALAAAGLLRLTRLRLDGRTLGALYWFLDRDRGRAFTYLQGLDPAAAGFSPGSLLVAAVAERAVAEGAAELDFLRGAEPYKYRWGAVDRRTWRVAFTHRQGRVAVTTTV